MFILRLLCRPFALVVLLVVSFHPPVSHAGTFGTPIEIPFVSDNGVVGHVAQCDEDATVHVLAANSNTAMFVLSKETGAPQWGQRGLGSSYDISRGTPRLRISKAGYGCAIWQSDSDTYVSTRAPGGAWATGISLDSSLQFFFTAHPGFDCAVNDTGEALAVWRTTTKLESAFKDAQGTWHPHTIRENLDTGDTQPQDFNVLLTDDARGRLFLVEIDFSTPAELSWTVEQLTYEDAVWTPGGQVLGPRVGGYGIDDLDYDPDSDSAVMMISKTVTDDEDTAPGAGLFFGTFAAFAAPGFTRLTNNEAVEGSGVGFSTSAAAVAGTLLPAGIYNKVTGSGTSHQGLVETSVPFAVFASDGENVAFEYMDVSASYHGEVFGIVGVYLRTNDVPLPKYSYRYEAAVSLAGVTQTHQVLSLPDLTTVFRAPHVATAACQDGSGTFIVRSASTGKLVSVDYTTGTTPGGTPLPDPPFGDGGFVAPDKATLGAETGIAKLFAAYGSGIAKCQQQALGAIAKAAGDAAKLATAATKLTACTGKAGAKLEGGRQKVVAKGVVPACLQTGFPTIKIDVDAQIALLGPLAACDGSLDAGTGLRIASSKAFLKGELGAAAAAVKAGSAAGKCFEKTTVAVFKAGGDAGKLAAAVAKHSECTAKAAGQGAGAIQKLVDKGLLPPCLSAVAAQGLVTSAGALGGVYSGEISCQ